MKILEYDTVHFTLSSWTTDSKLYYFLMSPTDDITQYPSYSRKDLALMPWQAHRRRKNGQFFCDDFTFSIRTAVFANRLRKFPQFFLDILMMDDADGAALMHFQSPSDFLSL